MDHRRGDARHRCGGCGLGSPGTLYQLEVALRERLPRPCEEVPEHRGACSVRVRRREQRRDVGTRPRSKHHRGARSDGIEDHGDVANLRLEVGERRSPSRQTRRSPVVADHTGEGRELFGQRPHGVALPQDLDPSLERVQPEEVDRAIADRVVRQRDAVGRAGVMRLRDRGAADHHVRILPPRHRVRNGPTGWVC